MIWFWSVSGTTAHSSKFWELKIICASRCPTSPQCGRELATNGAPPGNAGNLQAKGVLGNTGNSRAKGIHGNMGNSQGSPSNAGNTKTGTIKKRAGKRNGVRRSAKRALAAKKEWLELLLSGRKKWEIRGNPLPSAAETRSKIINPISSVSCSH